MILEVARRRLLSYVVQVVFNLKPAGLSVLWKTTRTTMTTFYKIRYDFGGCKKKAVVLCCPSCL